MNPVSAYLIKLAITVDALHSLTFTCHFLQVMLPPGGARFVLASDGIWDALHPSRACQLIRSTPLASASEHLAEVALKLTGPLDDMTAVVVDVLYPGTTFAELAAQRAQQQGVGLGTSSTGSSKTLVDLSMPRVPSYADSLTEEGCSVGGSSLQPVTL